MDSSYSNTMAVQMMQSPMMQDSMMGSSAYWNVNSLLFTLLLLGLVALVFMKVVKMAKER